MFILQVGNLKVKELLEVASAEVLIHYMLKEVELTWRNRFGDCQSALGLDGVDQVVLIVDMKGSSMKQIQSKVR